MGDEWMGGMAVENWRERCDEEEGWTSGSRGVGERASTAYSSRGEGVGRGSTPRRVGFRGSKAAMRGPSDAQKRYVRYLTKKTLLCGLPGDRTDGPMFDHGIGARRGGRGLGAGVGMGHLSGGGVGQGKASSPGEEARERRVERRGCNRRGHSDEASTVPGEAAWGRCGAGSSPGGGLRWRRLGGSVVAAPGREGCVESAPGGGCQWIGGGGLGGSVEKAPRRRGVGCVPVEWRREGGGRCGGGSTRRIRRREAAWGPVWRGVIEATPRGGRSLLRNP